MKNYNEIVKELKGMAGNQKKYNLAICDNIINAIMGVYMVKDYYSLNDCVKSFWGFLETGSLVF